MTSVAKLRTSVLCHCRKKWKSIGSYPLTVRSGSLFPLPTSSMPTLRYSAQQFISTNRLCPPISHLSASLFNNSQSNNAQSAKSQSQRPLLPHQLSLYHLPTGAYQYNFYSTSPQPQPKDDQDKQSNTELRKDGQKQGGRVADQDDSEPKGIMARFKDAYKNYGKVLIGVHCATSAVWFGTFYYAAYTGIDVIPLLEYIGLSERMISPFKSGLGDVAVAYLLYKLATPARYTVTILGTRETVKYLRAKGIMEPVQEGARLRDFVKESKEQVKERYEDLKEDVKEKSEEYKDKIEERKDELREKMEERRDAFKDRFKKP